MPSSTRRPTRSPAGAGPLLAVVPLILIAALAGCAGAPAPSADQSSITNNQEAGVDEGGIVKAWGDYLVILRRGRLFTVRLADRDLEPICMVDVYPEGSRLGTWYDEMLVDDRAVVVVGYSYTVGATELGLFELTDDGCVEHRDTYFLQSNDYYSSRNYASRIVEGQLVFYMPHYIDDYHLEDGRVVVDSRLPQFAQYTGRRRGYDWEEIIESSEIRPPVGQFSWPTLHTVVTCDLDPSHIGCRAQGMIGGYGRSFYVSPEAVYVWIHDGYAVGPNGEAPAAVYRLPLDGGEMGAVHVFGAPVDQFSFRERNGYLDVVVREMSGGDLMWGPEYSEGGVALVRIPLASFTPQGGHLKTASYRWLPQPEGYDFRNRFVGDHLIYGAAQYYASDASTLYVHPVDGQGETVALTVPHAIERLEALGEDAVVVGPSSQGLMFSSVQLRRPSTPRVVGQYLQPGAVQGEQRSHGFFFSQEGPGRGVVGLPIQRYGAYQHGYLFDSSVAVLYLEVDQLHFTEIGNLVATAEQVDDDCVVSCVDWYGNSRPIFYRQRVFALMGYELVEGVIRNDRIIEVGRVNLIRDLLG